MYQFSYAEVMQDSVTDAKERERQVLDRSIELLTAGARQEKNTAGKPSRHCSTPGACG